jgi:hypothetical protein
MVRAALSGYRSIECVQGRAKAAREGFAIVANQMMVAVLRGIPGNQ